MLFKISFYSKSNILNTFLSILFNSFILLKLFTFIINIYCANNCLITFDCAHSICSWNVTALFIFFWNTYSSKISEHSLKYSNIVSISYFMALALYTIYNAKCSLNSSNLQSYSPQYIVKNNHLNAPHLQYVKYSLYNKYVYFYFLLNLLYIFLIALFSIFIWINQVYPKNK